MDLLEYQSLLEDRARRHAAAIAPSVAEKAGVPVALAEAVLRERAYELALTEEPDIEQVDNLVHWAVRRVGKRRLLQKTKEALDPEYPKIEPPPWYHPYRRHRYRVRHRRKRVQEELRPRNIPFGKVEYDPKDKLDNPSRLPKFTTPETFNRHVTEVVEPYILALVKKVSEERELAPPNDEAVKRALEQVNWADAAYFAQQQSPSPGRVRLFLNKYLLHPLQRTAAKFPAEQVLFTTQALLVGTFIYRMLNKAVVAQTTIPKGVDTVMSVFKKLHWIRMGRP